MVNVVAAQDFAYEAGRITGMVVVVAVVLAGVAKARSSGGRRPASRSTLWVLLGVLAAVVVGIGVGLYRAGQAQLAMDRLTQRMAPLAEESRRKMAAGELDSVAEPLSQMVAVLKDFAREEDGSDGGMFALCFGQAVETVVPAAQHYDETVMAFMKMGGWDASSVAKNKDVAKRLALLPKAIAANREFVQSLKLLNGTIRSQLRQAGFDEGKAGRATDGFMRGANMTRAIRVHELEDELLALAQTQLRVLRDHPSAWRAKGARADFTGEISPEAQNAYVEAANRADQVLQEAADLMMRGN